MPAPHLHIPQHLFTPFHPHQVRELEGQDMRETIQDKVNAWFVENRNTDTGEYPDFPDKDDGGSKVILNPPLPTIQSLLEDGADPKGKDKGKAADKEEGHQGVGESVGSMEMGKGS